MGVYTRIMTLKTNVEHRREKSIVSFVSIDGEKVLTKNVNLSNVEAPVEIHY